MTDFTLFFYGLHLSSPFFPPLDSWVHPRLVVWVRKTKQAELTKYICLKFTQVCQQNWLKDSTLGCAFWGRRTELGSNRMPYFSTSVSTSSGFICSSACTALSSKPHRSAKIKLKDFQNHLCQHNFKINQNDQIT